MTVGTTPGVILCKSVILGELDRACSQECEFKGISGEIWCGRVGSAVVRIDK
jgi:hypothetical protein